MKRWVAESGEGRLPTPDQKDSWIRHCSMRGRSLAREAEVEVGVVVEDRASRFANAERAEGGGGLVNE